MVVEVLDVDRRRAVLVSLPELNVYDAVAASSRQLTATPPPPSPSHLAKHHSHRVSTSNKLTYARI